MTSTQASLHIRQADPRSAPDEVLLAVAGHREAMRAERVPQDPPWPLEMLVAEMRHAISDEEIVHWNAWDAERVIGHAALFLPLRENTHLGFLDLGVQAPYRRRGLGRALLNEAVTLLGTCGRAKLLGGTSDRVPAGAAFARLLGAETALAGHTNQLDLQDLDRGLLDDWTRRGAATATDYKVWLHDGPYPEERLPEIADLWTVMNTAPRGSLDMQDWRPTPALLREWEAQMAATGERRLTAFAEHRGSVSPSGGGRLVGYSELFWKPARASLLSQGATGVDPAHRRHGLGRWLKAANLRAALAANPRARFVRTGNADVNEAMLAINHQMGFKPFLVQLDWQVDLSRARAYLAGQ